MFPPHGSLIAREIAERDLRRHEELVGEARETRGTAKLTTSGSRGLPAGSASCSRQRAASSASSYAQASATRATSASGLFAAPAVSGALLAKRGAERRSPITMLAHARAEKAMLRNGSLAQSSAASVAVSTTAVSSSSLV